MTNEWLILGDTNGIVLPARRDQYDNAPRTIWNRAQVHTTMSSFGAKSAATIRRTPHGWVCTTTYSFNFTFRVEEENWNVNA